jgi:hypothetical protein
MSEDEAVAIQIANPPEARPERISRLVSRIESGDIKVPKFQRGFVWKRDQIIELLDSIYKGYPIGSVLLWRTNEKLPNERNIGGFHLPETQDQYPTNYILDGQQRLTTIYGALHPSASTTNPDFNVYFDLTDKIFFHLEGEPANTQIPVSILFDTTRFRQCQTFLSSLEGGKAYVNETDRLNETFREYSVPLITVTEPDTTQISLIFERINSTGTNLTIFDLMVAATWSEDFDLNDHVKAIVDEMDEKDFGNVGRATILRALSTCASKSAKRETILTLRTLDKAELLAQMERTKEALRRAVDFLATEVSVISDDFLPYERQLVLLAYVMAQAGQLNTETLRRWFWRTSFSERYRRGGEGLFDTDLDVAVKSLVDTSQLPHFGREVLPDVFHSSEFRKGTALSNAFVALLATQKPRNLTNGQAIDVRQSLSSYNRKEFHHIFPQAYLRSKGIPAERIGALANICILNSEQNKVIGAKSPSTYVATAKADLQGNFADAFSSNLISPECVAALEADDYEGFLKVRARHLATVANSLM